MELPDEVAIDLDGMTLGEIEDVEDLTGMSLGAIGVALSESPSVKVMRALVYVILRRSNPELTFEETRDIELGALQAAMTGGGSGDAVDPTPSSSGEAAA